MGYPRIIPSLEELSDAGLPPSLGLWTHFFSPTTERKDSRESCLNEYYEYSCWPRCWIIDSCCCQLPLLCKLRADDSLSAIELRLGGFLIIISLVSAHNRTVGICCGCSSSSWVNVHPSSKDCRLAPQAARADRTDRSDNDSYFWFWHP